MESMPSIQPVALRCWISRCGFSDRRVCRFASPGGVEHVVVVPSPSCRTIEDRSLATDEPPRGQAVQGLVTARLIMGETEHALLALPDGRAIPVEKSRIFLETTEGASPRRGRQV